MKAARLDAWCAVFSAGLTTQRDDWTTSAQTDRHQSIDPGREDGQTYAAAVHVEHCLRCWLLENRTSAFGIRFTRPRARARGESRDWHCRFWLRLSQTGGRTDGRTDRRRANQISDVFVPAYTQFRFDWRRNWLVVVSGGRYYFWLIRAASTGSSRITYSPRRRRRRPLTRTQCRYTSLP